MIWALTFFVYIVGILTGAWMSTWTRSPTEWWADWRADRKEREAQGCRGDF